MPRPTSLLRVIRKLKLSEHMRILYNTFDLHFNKQSHFGEPVRKFHFIQYCEFVPLFLRNVFN